MNTACVMVDCFLVEPKPIFICAFILAVWSLLVCIVGFPYIIWGEIQWYFPLFSSYIYRRAACDSVILFQPSILS